MINVDPGRLSRIVTDIYEAAYNQDAWGNTVEGLCHLFHGSKACLARIGPDPQPDDAITTNFDPKFHQIYIDELAALPNPLTDAVNSVPVGSIYHDHAVIGEALKKSRLWNEWMAPQNMYGGIASKLMASGSSFWIFDVQRGQHQNKFDVDDIALLEYLAPHLVRATKSAGGLNPCSRWRPHFPICHSAPSWSTATCGLLHRTRLPKQSCRGPAASLRKSPGIWCRPAPRACPHFKG